MTSDPTTTSPRRLYFSLVALFGMLNMICCLYSLVAPRWHGAEASSDGSGFAFGPWYSCTRTASVFSCKEIDLSVSFGTSTCTKESSFMQLSFYVLRALVLLTGVGCGLGFLVALTALGLGKKLVVWEKIAFIGTIAAVAIGLLANLAGIGFAVALFSKDLHCGKVCETAGAGIASCSEEWYHPAFVFFIGSGVSAIGATAAAVAGFVSMQLHPSSGSDNTGNDGQAYRADNNNSREMYNVSSPATTATQQQQQQQPFAYNPNPNQQQQQQAPTAALEMQEEPSHQPAADADGPPAGFEPPAGADWEWDPNSKMYWSDTEYLFLNPGNGHFYDPKSNHWYNPDSGAWYQTE